MVVLCSMSKLKCLTSFTTTSWSGSEPQGMTTVSFLKIGRNQYLYDMNIYSGKPVLGTCLLCVTYLSYVLNRGTSL